MTGAALYVGETQHRRFGPRPHGFRYRLFQILIDIDRLETAFEGLTMIQPGRWGLMSFEPRDHGDRLSADLRPWVLQALSRAGVPATAHTIRLLCFPRIMGLVFNPISLFFIHSADGLLEAVIYEVNNTFGQTHAYVIPACGEGVQIQQAEKRLYVSPFYRVEGGYRFEVSAPSDRFELRIIKLTDGRPDFFATQTAQREPLTDQRLAALFFSIPLMTLKVVLAIHWEALRLWIKGAPFGTRPPGPKAGVSAGEPSGAVRP
jgi:DUF1365 family protein